MGSLSFVFSEASNEPKTGYKKLNRPWSDPARLFYYRLFYSTIYDGESIDILIIILCNPTVLSQIAMRSI